MILEPIRKKYSPADDSFIGMRVGVLLIIALVLFGVLAFRLWYLQVLTGDTYVAEAASNQARKVAIEAPRGVIYDRNGQILVGNRSGLDVGLLPMDMYDPKKQPGEFHQEITDLAGVLDVSESDLLAAYDKAKKDPYVTYVVKEEVPEETTVAYIKEHSLELRGIEVDSTYLREYPFGALAAHVLGYVGEASQTDLDQEQFANLGSGATVGKDGVERTYDSFLRGTAGYKTVQVDAAGQPKGVTDETDPTPGNNLVLTIDANLEQAAENALAQGVQAAQTSGFANAAGGAVVALDPHTGQVLAMASYPTYDPSVWTNMTQAEYDDLTAPPAHEPLLDRAIDGLYPVGSTFKPFVAATALDAGLITPVSTFLCPGSFTVAGHTWKDWDPAPLGQVNVTEGLERSVDVFFYNVGYQLYQQPGPVLQDGVREFGFGQPTGVDLPGENAGRVPDKDWKATVGKTAADRAWTPGDDINLAIGQGDLLSTPLQVAVAFSAIANGGDVWIPHVGLELTDSSGNVVHPFDNQKAGHVDMSNSTLDAIRTGLKLVTSDPSGTAYQVFKDFPVTVAGKTGSAQVPPGDTEAWFEGYAPADNPQIVVVALVEHGGHGSSVAAPIVRDVMAAFFHTQAPGGSAVKATE